MPPEQRFWSKVDRSGDCWNWTGPLSTRGYGMFHLMVAPKRHKTVLAHRYSWFLSHPESGDGFVCHRCDNPKCVRPDHLFLGTPADNMHDMMVKGRHVNGMVLHPERAARGERVHCAKLRAVDIPEIVLARRRGEKLVDIAKRYGVKHSQIQSVLSGRTWKHVPRPA